MAEKIYHTLIAIGIALFFCVGQIALSNKFYLIALSYEGNVTAQYTGMIIGTGTLCVLLNRIRHTYWRSKKEDNSRRIPKILLEIPIAFGLQAITIIIYCVCALTIPDQTEAYTNYSASLTIDAMPYISVLYIVFIAPFFEELLFRGILTRVMQNTCGFWASNAIQALLFAIYHGNLFQGVYTFIFGMFLGYVAHKGNNLNYSIYLHILYNLIGITRFTDLLMQSNAPIIYSALIGVLATATGIVGFIKMNSKEKREIG